MKIVHLSCVAPPETGGIGSSALEEVNGLKQRGVDASLISATTHATRWRIGNAAALDIHQLLDELRAADVVHLHYPFYGTAGMIARLRAKGIIKRLVITLHMDATATGAKGFIFHAHRKFAQAKILKTADALIASSRDYAAHSSFAPFADRIVELPFGVDEKRFFSHELPSSVYRPSSILFVGGMDSAHAFKGVDVLLKAVAKLPEDVQCTLVGDGNLRASYEALARELKIEKRAAFLGKLPAEALADAYRSSGVLAFPSTSQAEAFGLVALEAQATGIPVVGSDLPGVRTVIANGETGFLVPPGDDGALAERLGYLLDHADVRIAMGKRARERVLERFTWTKHIEGLLKIYTDVCASQS